MGKIAVWALRYAPSVVVGVLLILFFGFTAVVTAPTDIFPNIDIPVVSVIWTFSGLPAEEFEKVAAKIEEKGLVKGRKVSRMLYASAVEVTPDKQGRIQLPAKLREYAGLDHDVTIIGSRSFAEIWNTEAWNANQETSDEDFTAAMEDLDF